MIAWITTCICSVYGDIPSQPRFNFDSVSDPSSVLLTNIIYSQGFASDEANYFYVSSGGGINVYDANGNSVTDFGAASGHQDNVTY